MVSMLVSVRVTLAVTSLYHVTVTTDVTVTGIATVAVTDLFDYLPDLE